MTADEPLDRPDAASGTARRASPASRGEGTRAVHRPVPPPLQQRPLALPVHRSAAYAFDSAEEFAGLLAGDRPGYSYGRVDNPTAVAFAAAVAALESAHLDEEVVAEPFGSGMAAVSSVLLGHLAAGDHVVAARDLYGTTASLLTGLLARFGVEATSVALRDLEAVRRALRPGRTRVLLAETIANPTTAVADLPALAALAADAGALLVVDSTFATPAACRPLEHGADLVVHSATKGLGGHADATGGVVVGRPAATAAVRAARIELGGVLAADEAFLLHRGLATLPLRVARSSATALQLATSLAEHPAVGTVLHPGLPWHPDAAVAARLLDPGRLGTTFTVTVSGGRQGGLDLCRALRLVDNASSLGSVHSKVSHVATSTHRQVSPEELAAVGLDASAVRVSVGLEDPEDLLDDLCAALDAVHEAWGPAVRERGGAALPDPGATTP